MTAPAMTIGRPSSIISVLILAAGRLFFRLCMVAHPAVLTYPKRGQVGERVCGACETPWPCLPAIRITLATIRWEHQHRPHARAGVERTPLAGPRHRAAVKRELPNPFKADALAPLALLMLAMLVCALTTIVTAQSFTGAETRKAGTPEPVIVPVLYPAPEPLLKPFDLTTTPRSR